MLVKGKLRILESACLQVEMRAILLVMKVMMTQVKIGLENMERKDEESQDTEDCDENIKLGIHYSSALIMIY